VASWPKAAIRRCANLSAQLGQWRNPSASFPVSVQLPALLLHRFASRSNVLIALFNVQAFGQSSSRALRFVPNLLCLLLTSARASRHLSMSVAQGTHQMSPGIAHPPSRLCLSDLRRRVPYNFRALMMRGHLTPPSRLVSASCSSGQRFAFGFLQICSRSRKPCRSADSAPCRASRGLSPPSKCALPGAPKKKAQLMEPR
jgi:hypothetical protein